MTQNEAIKIALDYMKKNMPSSTVLVNYVPIAVDMGRNWGVIFQRPGLPPAVGGGLPEIYVDKETRAVVRVEVGQ